MNENIDLTQILEGCPKGTKLYSSVYGEVEFDSTTDVGLFPIRVISGYHNYKFSNYGRIYPLLGECTLFPSKDQRDWSKFERFWDKPKVEKFDPKTFQPFDKVLARCTESEWMPTLFGFFIDTDNKDPFSPFVLGEKVVCVDIGYQQCIPYNDETKHLVGTLDDCPEYYKWWEE